MKTWALQVWVASVALALAACGDAASGEGAGSGGGSGGTGGTLDTGETAGASDPTGGPTGTSGTSGVSGTGDESESTSGVTTGECVMNCGVPHVLAQVVAGMHCTCVLWEDGGFRCWGSNPDYCTGWSPADAFTIGDNETPASVGDVPAGFTLSGLALAHHSCAVTSAGTVRCWGKADAEGALGRGAIPAAATGASEAVDVDLGADAVAIVVGHEFSCALTAERSVRCWGRNDTGQLGYGHTQNLGDDEPPSVAGDVSLGGEVIQMAAASFHVCALLASGHVRCWGSSGANEDGLFGGQLGLGHNDDIGDDELPSAVDPVALPNRAIRVAAQGAHSCAVLADGRLFCWGHNTFGQLGLGHNETIGDDETPTSAGHVGLPAPVIDLALYADGTCVLLDNNEVRCWGEGSAGQHGAGHEQILGIEELPADLPPLDLGPDEIVELAAGGAHVCARATNANIRCWGLNHAGQLGLGHTMDIGDDELPVAAGPVPYQ